LQKIQDVPLMIESDPPGVTVYLDGVKLDEGSLNDYSLSHLILGWQEGIQFIGKGGKIKLILPSVLGYGHNPPSGVRADAVLVFDIELKDFSN